MDGQIEQLKERTLGFEVSGRRADYDTNQDPIVRASAAEIRKPITQCYHQPGHGTELAVNCHSVHMYRYFIWPRPS